MHTDEEKLAEWISPCSIATATAPASHRQVRGALGARAAAGRSHLLRRRGWVLQFTVSPSRKAKEPARLSKSSVVRSGVEHFDMDDRF